MDFYKFNMPVFCPGIIIKKKLIHFVSSVSSDYVKKSPKNELHTGLLQFANAVTSHSLKAQKFGFGF